MKQQITKISVLQTSKVLAALYAVFGVLIMPFGCLLLAFGAEDTSSRIMAIVYILGPVLYGVVAFIFGLLCTWLYNVIASRIGGIEFELGEARTAPVS
jgi:drug/metabolite transporter (DMT)-like permease